MIEGEWKVVGKREYRGNAPGTVWQGRIPEGPARRAIDRGDVVLLRTITQELQPGWQLPDGWVTDNPNHGKE